MTQAKATAMSETASQDFKLVSLPRPPAPAPSALPRPMLDNLVQSLQEAVTQARNDAAKLPGPKGRMLEQQASRWSRALKNARDMAIRDPADLPLDREATALIGWLSHAAEGLEQLAGINNTGALQMRGVAAKLKALIDTPRAPRAPDIIDAGRFRLMGKLMAEQPGFRERLQACVDHEAVCNLLDDEHHAQFLRGER